MTQALAIIERTCRLGRARTGRPGGDHRDAALHAALLDRRKEMNLRDLHGRNLRQDVLQKTLTRLGQHRHRAAGSVFPRAIARDSSSRSTYNRRMCMKSCAFVTTPNA